MNWINRKSTYSEVLDVLEDKISIYKGKVLTHVSLPHDEWLRKYYMKELKKYQSVFDFINNDTRESYYVDIVDIDCCENCQIRIYGEKKDKINIYVPVIINGKYEASLIKFPDRVGCYVKIVYDEDSNITNDSEIYDGCCVRLVDDEHEKEVDISSIPEVAKFYREVYPTATLGLNFYDEQSVKDCCQRINNDRSRYLRLGL